MCFCHVEMARMCGRDENMWTVATSTKNANKIDRSIVLFPFLETKQPKNSKNKINCKYNTLIRFNAIAAVLWCRAVWGTQANHVIRLIRFNSVKQKFKAEKQETVCSCNENEVSLVVDCVYVHCKHPQSGNVKNVIWFGMPCSDNGHRYLSSAFNAIYTKPHTHTIREHYYELTEGNVSFIWLSMAIS